MGLHHHYKIGYIGDHQTSATLQEQYAGRGLLGDFSIDQEGPVFLNFLIIGW